ncbi:unnamed protein product [Rotaria sordida]|uniref:PLAT domain-containing protein n=1 Tax=Rotaria sordida TaxID=392033 RepID=A0A814D9F3_9BILA|nr:unnamed protein product [Rotaria sordida]CAF0954059.1 unnamed protein product [Rotaria sordida]CAF3582411.1 unnamed protein product [Rotaria sordida]CAF3616858.1 unnamed protein product [Rotaria sordida]
MSTVGSLAIFNATNLIRNEDKTTMLTTIEDTTTSYKGYLFFEIYTADEQGAGTDSNIYVTIVGTKNNLTRQALRSIGPSMNAFERNQVDVCMIYTNVKFDKTDNIIQGVELINDGKWVGSPWKPSCIYLSGVDGAQTNDQWIISGNPVFISLLEPNKAAFCLWPVIQELQEAKRLKEKQKMPMDPHGFVNVTSERI